MEGLYFQLNIKALALVFGLAVLLFFLRRWRKTFDVPHLSFSHLSSFSVGKGRASLNWLPPALLWSSLFSFSLAFTDPHLLLDRKWENSGMPTSPRDAGQPPPTEGIAIYLVLDRSGSMSDKVLARTPTGNRRYLSKIDLVKEMTSKFIQGDPAIGLAGRPDDLIGLIFFARAANVEAPLTLDHGAVLQQLAKYNVIGQMDLDGTGIGYALFKTANLIAATRRYSQELAQQGEAPAYSIKSSVIILLTDGLQDPNPLDKGKRLRNMDIPEAAAYIKEQGIRLYVVTVDPELSTEQYAPYRHILQRATESTGGKYFMVDSITNLDQIYKAIDQLEKSAIPVQYKEINKDDRPDLYKRISFYPYLIALGLLCLLASVLLETVFLRKVP
jgi:Ca-activated chloride channel family protein